MQRLWRHIRETRAPHGQLRASQPHQLSVHGDGGGNPDPYLPIHSKALRFLPSSLRLQKQRSCLTNISCFLDEATRSLDDGKQIKVSYLEFSKAPDAENLRLLLADLG